MNRLVNALCAASVAAAALAAAPAFSQSAMDPELGTPVDRSDHPHYAPPRLYPPRVPDIFLNGFRGYRDYRHGYRQHQGFWYPPQAFGVEIYVDRSRRSSRYDSRYDREDFSRAHVDWCYDTYRSYREWDNTFQPYRGPRRQCYSPYS